MKALVIRALSWLNRRLKAWLGVSAGEVREPPRRPYHLTRERAGANVVRTFERGRLVFVQEFCSRGAGGLADVLHLGMELQRQGELEVYFKAVGGQTEQDCWENIHWTHPGVRREQVVDALPFAPEFLCATAWPTAYHVLDMPSARKLYFVQDYEPWFHRAGIEQYYAAQSYERGLEMFTLGPWLAGHIHRTHGVACRGFMPFPASDEPRPGRPLGERRKISFYVQPDKIHRGGEMLLECARRLSRHISDRRLDLDVVIFGSIENEYLQLDFPCRALGVLTEPELIRLFQDTRVGICSSFTNLSLIPFRFIAHGCVTLDLDQPGVQQNVPDAARDLFGFYRPEPDALLAAIVSALARDRSEESRRRAAEALCRGHNWPACARSVLPLFAGATSSAPVGS